MVSKKGLAIGQMLMGLVFIVVLGIVALVGYSTFNDLNTDLQASLDMSNQSKNTSAESFSDYPTTMDGMFVTFIALLFVLFLVASYYAVSNPLYFILMVLILIAVFIVAGFLSNAWGEVADETDLSAGAVAMPMTNWLLDNYILFFVAAGFSSLLAMYLKSRGGVV